MAPKVISSPPPPTYDKNGNRITVTGPTAGTYVTGPGNRYTTDGTFNYTYDAEGNLKTKTEIVTGNVTEYTWDYRNRLMKVEERTQGESVLSVSEYVYDSLDRRIVMTANGELVRTVYDHSDAWADYAAGGALTHRYLVGDKIDEVLVRWQPVTRSEWSLADRLGTVHTLIDWFGAASRFVDYSVFGKILSPPGQSVVYRFTFMGRELNQATGDYYYRARYYHPDSGRFLSPDPIGFESMDVNTLRFVGNSPTNLTDPTGTFSIGEAATLIGTTYAYVRTFVTLLRITVTASEAGATSATVIFSLGKAAVAHVGAMLSIAVTLSCSLSSTPFKQCVADFFDTFYRE